MSSGERLVDFGEIPRRLRLPVAIVAGLCLVGAVVDGVVAGLTFATIVRWTGVFLLVVVLTAAVVTAVHALRGASAAEDRGERLSSGDVGLVPPRRRRPE